MNRRSHARSVVSTMALSIRLRWPALLAACACGAAVASDRSLAQPLLPVYRQECGTCHTAYPPGLLPAASWERLLGNLPRHYGSDASLDDATVAQLRGWLLPLAGTARRVAAAPPPPDDRITQSSWFVRKHREVTPATWKLPAVRSAANCAACHAGADKGTFDEHAVRIPR